MHKCKSTASPLNNLSNKENGLFTKVAIMHRLIVVRSDHNKLEKGTPRIKVIEFN